MIPVLTIPVVVIDRRYWNRHEPTIPDWYPVFGKYRPRHRRRRAWEPIEDEV